MRKCPPRSSSSTAPKTEGESKRGQQSQSMEPFTPTKATLLPSPMTPYLEVSSGVPSGTKAVDMRLDEV